MAQSTKCLTFYFGLGCDPTAHEFEPYIRFCADGAEPSWDSVSPSLCPSPVHSLPLSK